ncbi:hypothetical protein ACFWY9_29085 [Amycolatopsis sp. NPDC059027]|uniref:hypothetical protein n=1 Tax=unclassified Amycolatopsis TaxID=2618356 RepID=UPI00366EEA60
MTEKPSAEEAANALRGIDRRKAQAVGAAQYGARWVDVVFGVVFFLYMAITDFLPDAVAWSNLVLAVLVVGYVVAKRTRRGGALLGHGARLDRRAIPPRSVFIGLAVVAVGCALSITVAMLQLNVPIPYLRTGMGAVLGLALILFGRKLNDALVALARRGPRQGGPADGRF